MPQTLVYCMHLLMPLNIHSGFFSVVYSVILRQVNACFQCLRKRREYLGESNPWHFPFFSDYLAIEALFDCHIKALGF